MNKQEFEDRTGVSVSFEEYSKIEDYYYDFSGDKDEFCENWCILNPKRVKDAKRRRKEIEARRNFVDRLWSIVGKIDCYFARKGYRPYLDEPLSVDFFNKKDWAILSKIGITKWMYSEEEAHKFGYITESGINVAPHARISDTELKIKKYLKMA